VLSLRYTISVKGLEHLDKKIASLIMPSHIALVDPIIIRSLLNKKVVLHPVMTKLYYSNIFLHPLFRLMHAVPVEEFDRDKGSLEDATRMMEQVSKSLNE
jgi:1-acyl-sn-glycerol-3-phosphate acyltransferase